MSKFSLLNPPVSVTWFPCFRNDRGRVEEVVVGEGCGGDEISALQPGHGHRQGERKLTDPIPQVQAQTRVSSPLHSSLLNSRVKTATEPISGSDLYDGHSLDDCQDIWNQS